MAGASVIFGLGMLESGITFDFQEAVLDNDLAAMVKFAVNGVTINEETLALSEIAAVGSQGDFLMSPSTLKYMRSLPSAPEFYERLNRQRWLEKDKPDAEKIAQIKLKDIFSSHKVATLQPSIAQEISSLIKEEEKKVGAQSQNIQFAPDANYIK